MPEPVADHTDAATDVGAADEAAERLAEGHPRRGVHRVQHQEVGKVELPPFVYADRIEEVGDGGIDEGFVIFRASDSEGARYTSPQLSVPSFVLCAHEAGHFFAVFDAEEDAVGVGGYEARPGAVDDVDGARVAEGDALDAVADDWTVLRVERCELRSQLTVVLLVGAPEIGEAGKEWTRDGLGDGDVVRD